MPKIKYKLKSGTPVSGVTTIIGQNLGWNKEALKYWAWDLGMQGIDFREVAGAAADAGTVAHILVEADILGVAPVLPVDLPDEVLKNGQQGYANFLRWKEMVKFKLYDTEVSIVSEKYAYGLTPDCVAYINNKLSLFDWKTSNAVYADYLIQLAGYKIGWDEAFPDLPLVGGCHLIRFPKESAAFTHHFWEWETIEKAGAFQAFLVLRELHDIQKKLKKLL